MSSDENQSKPALSALDMQCSSAPPSICESQVLMRSVSFPLVDGCPASPSPSTMSMSEPEWLNAVRAKSFILYCQAKRKSIPLAKYRRGHRLPIEVDDSDDEDNLTIAAEDTSTDADSVAYDEADPAASAASVAYDEADPAASAASVSLLFQRLTKQVYPRATSSQSEAAAEQKPIDWNTPGQLEAFLERCVEGWEMQQQYVAQHKQMMRALEKMQKRINEAEDENALLIWYAHHLKGGSTAPITADVSAAVLQEAKSAILTLAASSLKTTPEA